MNPSKKQLDFALPIAILIVVALIVAGGAGYYFYKTSVDETTDWETYINIKYGYSFKYPPECRYGEWTPEVRPTEQFCFLSIENPDDVLLNTRYTSEKEGLVSAVFSVRYCSDSWDKETDSSCSPADFLIHNPPFGTELVSWFKENYKEGLNGDIPDKPNFEIDGIPAVKILNEFPLDPPNERIFLIKNDKLFDITLWHVDNESNKKLYNQILSTFKFIEIDETANWNTYRNEEYGFEVRYPKDWKIVNVDWTVGREYVQFLSPLINNKYYFVLNFGARNKGDNTQISYQPDEDWELLKSLMRLGDKVKIGNVDVLTTEIVEKGKVHGILYSNRLGAGRIEISGLEIQADSGIIEGPQHLSASDVESIDLKNLLEFKIANQILSTFKFIELEGAKEEKEEAVVVPNVPMMLDLDTEAATGSPYTIGWRAIEGATNYILERDIDSSFSNPIIVSSRTLNSFSGTLSPSVSTRYYFRVKACNKYGCSSWGKQTTLWIEVIVPSIREEEKSEPLIGKYSSPEKTFSLSIKVMEEGDVDAYLESFTEESQEMLRGKVASDYLKRMAGLYKETEFKVIEKTSDMAVMAVVTLEKTILPGIFIFKKEKGDWKIDFKEQFFSSLYEEEIKKGPILHRLEEIKEEARSQARDGKRIADLMQLWPALELYFSQYGGYPVLTDTSEDGEFLKVLVDEGYFSQMFLDPQHPERYYEYNGTRESFILKGYIEEGGGIIDMRDGVKDNAYTITSP